MPRVSLMGKSQRMNGFRPGDYMCPNPPTQAAPLLGKGFATYMTHMTLHTHTHSLQPPLPSWQLNLTVFATAELDPVKATA